MIDLHNPFNLFLVAPILNILVVIYHGLVLAHFPYALGFSIILLTILIRIILYPLTASQLKTSFKMQKITPHLNKLKEKHKNDAKTLQAETMKLYKEHGVNPAAGCLPVIIQLPLIWALYNVLQRVVAAKPAAIVSLVNSVVYSPALKLHTAWDQHFFGLALGQSPAKLMPTVGIGIILFPVATAVFQFLQSKMMFGSVDAKNTKGNEIVVAQKEGEKKEKKGDDFSTAMQTQSMYVFPLMIGFFSYTLPLGLSLYWNTFTIFGIIQQYQIQGLGGLAPWIAKIKAYGSKR